MYGRVHDGIMSSRVLSLWVLAFINVKQCVFGCAMRVLADLWFCLVVYVGS